jgi:sulfur transfer protein SufE
VGHRAVDVDEFYMKLDLEEHLAPNRRIGGYLIVERMKQQVRQLMDYK